MNRKAGPLPRSSTLSESSPMSILGMPVGLFAVRQHLGHLDRAALACAAHPGLDDREVAGRPEAVGLRARAGADAVRELLELLADGVVLGGRDWPRRLLAALEVAQAREQVVIGARLFAVDVHHVV